MLNTGPIDTYPGLAPGVSGPDLVGRLTEQVVDFDVTMEFGTATEIRQEGANFLVVADDAEFSGRAVIIATGARSRHLGVPGAEELIGRGVSDCAVCDGGFFVDQPVFVVGAGDKAVEGALHLAQNGSTVSVLMRGSEFRAVDHLRRRLSAESRVTIVPNVEIEEILGDEKVEGVRVRDAAGHDQASGWKRCVRQHRGRTRERVGG